MKKALQVTLIIFVLIGALWWPQLTQANFDGSLGSERKDRHSQLLMCSSAQQQWTTVLQRSWVQKSALFRWKMKVFILTNPYHEESFHPNKSLPRRRLFHNYGLFTGRECNVFDMRLLQIPKVTHVSVSAKLLVAKLYWGPLLIFEPKVAKYRSMDLVFGIIQRSHVKDASFYSLQHPCTLAQVTCTECQKWRNMLSWGVRLELYK